MLCNRGGRVFSSRSLDPLGSAWEPLNFTGITAAVGPTAGVKLPSGRLAIAAYQEART
jgi:hypothetical protein